MKLVQVSGTVRFLSVCLSHLLLSPNHSNIHFSGHILPSVSHKLILASPTTKFYQFVFFKVDNYMYK